MAVAIFFRNHMLFPSQLHKRVAFVFLQDDYSLYMASTRICYRLAIGEFDENYSNEVAENTQVFSYVLLIDFCAVLLETSVVISLILEHASSACHCRRPCWYVKYD